MSVSQHTAGPYGIDNNVEVYGFADTRFIRRIYAHDPGSERDFTIGFVRDVDPRILAVHCALLAAAPDLLAALEEVNMLLTYHADDVEKGPEEDGFVWDNERIEDAIQQARTAINKAKGITK